MVCPRAVHFRRVYQAESSHEVRRLRAIYLFILDMTVLQSVLKNQDDADIRGHAEAKSQTACSSPDPHMLKASVVKGLKLQCNQS